MPVVFQPVLLNAWCTLCLASAVISVLMIGRAMDEILANLQHVRRERDRGRSTWRVVWGTVEGRYGGGRSRVWRGYGVSDQRLRGEGGARPQVRAPSTLRSGRVGRGGDGAL